MKTKIKNSKGEIYNSCPFIDEILSKLDEQIEICKSMKENLEKIRQINQELRSLRDEEINKLQNFRDKFEIVNAELSIDSNDLEWIKFNVKDISNKLEDLEKENKELKEEIDNIKQQ